MSPPLLQGIGWPVQWGSKPCSYLSDDLPLLPRFVEAQTGRAAPPHRRQPGPRWRTQSPPRPSAATLHTRKQPTKTWLMETCCCLIITNSRQVVVHCSSWLVKYKKLFLTAKSHSCELCAQNTPCSPDMSCTVRQAVCWNNACFVSTVVVPPHTNRWYFHEGNKYFYAHC